MPEALASAATTTGARLIHISTDYVFDGTATRPTPRPPPSGLGVYGRSKAAGEAATLARGRYGDDRAHSLAVRTLRKELRGHGPQRLAAAGGLADRRRPVPGSRRSPGMSPDASST